VTPSRGSGVIGIWKEFRMFSIPVAINECFKMDHIYEEKRFNIYHGVKLLICKKWVSQYQVICGLSDKVNLSVRLNRMNFSKNLVITLSANMNLLNLSF